MQTKSPPVSSTSSGRAAASLAGSARLDQLGATDDVAAIPLTGRVLPAHLFDKMSAPACIHKRSHGPATHGVDRLSSLPDPLLHLVMSFLPMPEVVRTSLLSPRWRYLWASVPFIHLDYKDFVDVDDDQGKRMADLNRLQKFGDQLLLLRDGTLPLDEARIFIRCGCSSDKCYAWIHHAIKHKARLLHVYGPCDHEVLCDNTTLLPSQHLKRIKLQKVSLLDTYFRLLNFDFAVLEHIVMEHCNIYGDQKISSKSLNTISISFCHFNGGLEICAPNLNHLSILDPTFEKGCAMVTRDLYALVTTSVSLRFGAYHVNQDEISDHGVLNGLSHVTTLELDAPLPEPTLERSLQTCPVFGNLTSLLLGEWCLASDFAPLLRILRQSPKLKDLTFKLRMKQHGTSKDAEHTPLLREASSLDGYHGIQRATIYCTSKDDPRVSALVKVLRIVIPDGEISING